MKYPNAAKGMRILVTAEIVALVSSILVVIVSLFELPGVDIDEMIDRAFEASDIVLMLIIIASYLAAYIMEIIGILIASKDEPAFKVSLYAIIASIIITVLASFFYQNEAITYIIMIGGDVAQFFLVHYIVHGIMHLSDHLGRSDISKKGSVIFRVIYAGLVFEVIVRLFELVYGMKLAESLAMPFDVIANILKTVEYLLFLILIVKGNKMLREAKTES